MLPKNFLSRTRECRASAEPVMTGVCKFVLALRVHVLNFERTNTTEKCLKTDPRCKRVFGSNLPKTSLKTGPLMRERILLSMVSA